MVSASDGRGWKACASASGPAMLRTVLSGLAPTGACSATREALRRHSVFESCGSDHGIRKTPAISWPVGARPDRSVVVHRVDYQPASGAATAGANSGSRPRTRGKLGFQAPKVGRNSGSALVVSATSPGMAGPTEDPWAGRGRARRPGDAGREGRGHPGPRRRGAARRGGGARRPRVSTPFFVFPADPEFPRVSADSAPPRGPARPRAPPPRRAGRGARPPRGGPGRQPARGPGRLVHPSAWRLAPISSGTTSCAGQELISPISCDTEHGSRFCQRAAMGSPVISHRPPRATVSQPPPLRGSVPTRPASRSTGPRSASPCPARSRTRPEQNPSFPRISGSGTRVCAGGGGTGRGLVGVPRDRPEPGGPADLPSGPSARS
jgi:hypothetical protein